MKPLSSLPALLAAALLLAGCEGGERPPTGPHTDAQGKLRYGELVFEPCALDAPRGGSVEAQCTTLEVPEDHSAPDGRRISLAIALVPAKGMAEPDPIYMISGGPGQSAIETFPMLSEAFADVRRNRHVVLVDARGTGGSNPLHCPGFSDEAAFGAGAQDDTATLVRLTEACRDELSQRADLRFYGTGDHVRDLDLVRRKLGVERINLVGVSYGTRVAQQYAAAFPDHTRAVVLDSVVPNTLVLGQEHARNLEQALDAQFARCRNDQACLTNLGDPRRQLAVVRERLRAGGIDPVRYRDPVSGDWREEVPREVHLVSLLRRYAKSDLPPSLIKAINRWDEVGGEVRAERVSMLRVSRAEILEELRNSPAARFLGEPLGPLTVIVPEDALEKVMAALARMGYLSDVNF